MNGKTLGMIVLVLGVVCLVVGGIFVWQSFDVKAKVAEGLLDEQITTGIPRAARGVPGDEDYRAEEEGYDPNNTYVDTAAEAQVAHDTILHHMRDGDTPRYGDTPRDSPERAAYIDGITLRNSLTIAVMGFGISTIALGVGAFMLVIGVALGATGLAIRVRE